jgi:TolB protein
MLKERGQGRPLTLSLVALLFAIPLSAQDTTAQRGVRIGLTYEPGTRPGVVVLPVSGAHGDSVRTIIQRDLDFSDRMVIVGADGGTVADVARSQGGTMNYGLWKQLGAHAIVQATSTASGVRVAVHDVSAANILSARDFSLPQPALSASWRMALHGVSDEIERWITSTRGIAQTRVAFVRGGRVYVADSDGHGERAVTEGGTALSPSWHPSGRSIAYSTFGQRGTQIVVRDVQGGGTRVVSSRPGLNITPEFSPDGSQLVWSFGEENGADLVVAPATGGDQRRITVGRGSDNVSPSFSPDGRRLAFTSNRAGHPEIYTADVDGTNVELLTTYLAGDQSYRSNPAWSPDGRVVAFQSQVAGRFQIFTISLRDRSMKQLTSEGINEDPSWAPDGRHLVFTSSRTGTKQLFVLDAESGRARQLTRSGGTRLAAWSRVLDRVP